jgi:pimeloyl-ACP methyl ester carboxylesterase
VDAFARTLSDGAQVGLPPLRPLAVQESPLSPEASAVEIVTPAGIITCLRHAGPVGGGEAVALFLGGALGGLSGPNGLWHEVAGRTGGVRVHYRRPGDLESCLMDVLLVHHLLARRGTERVALVGHSFGGAVAIGAGVLLGHGCAGVAALSTQVPGTEQVDRLAGLPLLLVHGDADSVLPDLCSRNVHERAGEPKDLLILPGEGHLLEGATSLLTERLTAFLTESLA